MNLKISSQKLSEYFLDYWDQQLYIGKYLIFIHRKKNWFVVATDIFDNLISVVDTANIVIDGTNNSNYVII